MAYANPNPKGVIDIQRIKAFDASWVGDSTAGGNNNVQTYLDARRFLRGKVADITARNALSAPADGDVAFVLDDGTGLPAWHVYRSAAALWGPVVAGGASFKTPVRLATTAALAANTRTGNVLTASANGVLGNIDGVAPALGDRVLVKDEVTTANNGIYTITSLGAVGSPWQLTRSTDADATGEVLPDTYVFVAEGTANADIPFVCTTNAPITLNTTGLTFATVGSNASTLGGAAAATTATANTIAKRDGNAYLFAAQHASIGAAGAAGAVIVADAGGKVPAAALPTTDSTLLAWIAL